MIIKLWPKNPLDRTVQRLLVIGSLNPSIACSAFAKHFWNFGVIIIYWYRRTFWTVEIVVKMHKCKKRDVLNNRRMVREKNLIIAKAMINVTMTIIIIISPWSPRPWRSFFITKEKSNLLSKARAPPRPIWQRTSEPDVVKKLELYKRLDFRLLKDVIYGPAIENGYFNSDKHLLSFCWGLQMMMYSLGKNWGTVRCKWSHNESNFDLHHNHR